MPTVLVNGLKLFFEDLGTGTPVVFVSGLGGDHRAFAVAMRRLGRTYRAITFDNRDSGQSERATTTYSTADLAEDLAGLLAAIQVESAHFVGQSLGGLIAQQLALRHPSLVRSLTLVSTHSGSNAWKKAVIASWVALKRTSGPDAFARGTLPWLVAPSFYENALAQIEGIVRFADRNEWPQDGDAFERQAQAASTHDLRDRLGKINVPTLVLTGEFDIVNPPAVSRELADRIPNARFQLLKGVGHIPHVENVGDFLDAIEAFLNEVG